MFERLIVVLMLLASPAIAGERAPYTLGPLVVAPGSAASGLLVIAPRDDAGTVIPVSVFHGTAPGPVLALIAGTHGYEYPPIIALQRVRQSLDPADLAGTLVLVHVANMPSFLGRTIYNGPVDGLNLNRVYPGRADGSISERIADVITRQIIERADFVVDMHGGDGNEDLRPYIYMPETGDAALDQAARGMALAFGIDHIIIDKSPVENPAASIYTDRTAISRGIPAISTETGGLGASTGADTDLAEAGVYNLLQHLGMMSGTPRETTDITWFHNTKVVYSPATATFRPAVQKGEIVFKDQSLGTLVDFFGVTLSDVPAPFAGIVLYVVATPPVSEGEPLAMMGEVRTDRGESRQ